MSYLANLTDEEREENLKKARKARQEKKEWAEKHLKMNCADDPLWTELAAKYKFRLPNRADKAAAKFVQRFIKHFNVDISWYEEVTGFKNGNAEARVNPRMTARQQIGLLLEEWDWQNEGNNP